MAWHIPRTAPLQPWPAPLSPLAAPLKCASYPAAPFGAIDESAAPLAAPIRHLEHHRACRRKPSTHRANHHTRHQLLHRDSVYKVGAATFVRMHTRRPANFTIGRECECWRPAWRVTADLGTYLYSTDAPNTHCLKGRRTTNTQLEQCHHGSAICSASKAWPPRSWTARSQQHLDSSTRARGALSRYHPRHQCPRNSFPPRLHKVQLTQRQHSPVFQQHLFYAPISLLACPRRPRCSPSASPSCGECSIPSPIS